LQALEPLPRVARYPEVSRRAIRLDRNTGRGIACVCQKADAFRAPALIWCMRGRKPFATARAASNLRFEPLRCPGFAGLHAPQTWVQAPGLGTGV